MKNKRFNKIFRKNIISISAFVILFAVISSTIYIIRNSSARQEKMNLLESQVLSNTEASMRNVFTQMLASCSYFANVTFYINAQSPDSDYSLISKVQKQMEVVIASSSAIENIKIIDKQTASELKSGVGSDRIKPGKTYTRINGSFFVENKDSDGSELLLFMDCRENEYARNSVYLGINSRYFADTIFGDQEEQREEYIVDGNGNILVSRDSRNVNQNLKDLYGTKINVKNQNVTLAEINGVKKYLTIKKTKNYDMYIVSLADTDIYENFIISNNNTVERSLFST